MWNIINYYKISQFLIKISKSPIDFRKILLKCLGKTVKYWHSFINFHSCTEKMVKHWPTFVHTIMVFHEGFLSPKLSVLMKFRLISSHLWPKSSASHKHCSYIVDVALSENRTSSFDRHYNRLNCVSYSLTRCIFFETWNDLTYYLMWFSLEKDFLGQILSQKH